METPITQQGVTPEEDGWRIDFTSGNEVILFAIDHPSVTALQILTYRAEMRTRGAMGRVYLKMLIDVAHEPEQFSRDVRDAVLGWTDWSPYHAAFYLKEDQFPTRIELGVVCEGPGTVWIRNIALLSTPIV